MCCVSAFQFLLECDAASATRSPEGNLSTLEKGSTLTEVTLAEDFEENATFVFLWVKVPRGPI